MHLLIIGPDHDRGSIPPYLEVLAGALRAEGVTVDRAGSASLPYDIETQCFWAADRVVAAADDLLQQVDLPTYDLVSVHFGNLEIEQLLPVLWADRPHPPAVYHVHTLHPTLFRTHIPAPALQRAVTDGIRSMDGYVYFGRFAQARFHSRFGEGPAETVAWLPTTIPPGSQPALTPALEAALAAPDGRLVVSLYGFAAPWKDPATLLAAVDLLDHPVRVVLAGPFWDDPSQAGRRLRRGKSHLGQHGQTELVVVPDYLDPNHRSALIAASDLAVFPYQPHPSFQGSGAIADYVAHGTPVVATDVANMAELVGDAGCIVPPNSAVALADALQTLLTDAGRDSVTHAAWQRASLFTPALHAQTCLQLYSSMAGLARDRA